MFIVSNTYYSASDLKAFVRLDVPIYTSADHGVSKQGGLLAKVIAENNLVGKKVLHVGDDQEADFKTAMAVGAFGMRYRPYQNEALSLLKSLRDTAVKEFGKAPILDIKTGLIDKQFENDVELYGYSLVGPIVSHFLHAIAKTASGRIVTFMGRDSKLLHDLYQGAKQYLELNRLQVWKASLYDESDVAEAFAYTKDKVAHPHPRSHQCGLQGI